MVPKIGKEKVQEVKEGQERQVREKFLKLAFRHAGACLTLLCNTVEENLRGMKE